MTTNTDPALRALTYLRNEGWCSDDPATTEYNLRVVRGALAAAAEAAPLDAEYAARLALNDEFAAGLVAGLNVAAAEAAPLDAALAAAGITADEAIEAVRGQRAEAAPLDVERLQSALWALMKRNGWRISTGLDDLPPNAVVEAIAREYAALAATSRDFLVRAVDKGALAKAIAMVEVTRAQVQGYVWEGPERTWFDGYAEDIAEQYELLIKERANA